MAGAESWVVGAAPSSGPAGDVVIAVRTATVRVAVAERTNTRASWWTFWESTRLSPRRLVEGAVIHATDFEMSRLRSTFHLLSCQRSAVQSGVVCSLSRVPSSRGALGSMISLAATICVPGLALSAIVGAEGNLVVRMTLLITVCLLAVVGIASCTRRVVEARRWPGFDGRGVVIANVAVDTRGIGLARGLLSEVVRVADEAGCTLLLAVRASNVGAAGLYRSLGFVEDPDVTVRSGHSAMVRTPADGCARPGLDSAPAAGAIVAGYVVVATYLLVAATSLSLPARISVVGALLLLCSAALVDLKALRLPNRLVFGAAVFVALAITLADSWDSAFVAAGMAAAPLLLVHLVDPAAFGFGDVKYAAVAGALLATWWWPAAIVTVLVALGSACVARLVRLGGPLAFGPSLFVGTLSAVVVSIVLVEKGLVI